MAVWGWCAWNPWPKAPKLPRIFFFYVVGLFCQPRAGLSVATEMRRLMTLGPQVGGVHRGRGPLRSHWGDSGEAGRAGLAGAAGRGRVDMLSLGFLPTKRKIVECNMIDMSFLVYFSLRCHFYVSAEKSLYTAEHVAVPPMYTYRELQGAPGSSRGEDALETTSFT